MSDTKKYMVLRGFFYHGARQNVGDVVELDRRTAGEMLGTNHVKETEAKPTKAAERSTKATGLPE